MVYVHTSWPDCRRCKQQAGGPRDRHRQTLSPSQRQTDRHTQVHTYVHISNLSIATKPRNSPVYLSLRFLMASGVRSPSATVIWVPTTACPRRHCPTRKLFEAAERHHFGTARFDVTDRIGSLHSSLQDSRQGSTIVNAHHQQRPYRPVSPRQRCNGPRSSPLLSESEQPRMCATHMYVSTYICLHTHAHVCNRTRRATCKSIGACVRAQRSERLVAQICTPTCAVMSS